MPLKKIEGVLLSRRTAVILLAAMVAMLVLSTRAERISDVTTSPFFFVLPFFVFCSVLACSLNRIRTRRGSSPNATAFEKGSRSLPQARRTAEEASRYLAGRGWGIHSTAADGILLHKGRAGFWGSMLFHLGLLLILAASVVTAATLFSAEILLNEGEPVALNRQGFLRILREPPLEARFSVATVRLDRFDAEYRDSIFPVDYAAHVSVTQNGRTEQLVSRVNQPLEIDGLMYTLDQYGFSPGFRIEDREGRLLFDGYVTLIIRDREEDSFRVPDTDYFIDVVFFPDYLKRNDLHDSRSNVPNNPYFGLKVRHLLDEGGEGGKLVRLGETTEIRGLRITPTELKYWAHFGVTRDWGKPLFLVSFLFVSTGLSIRFFCYEKWILLTIREGTVERISGYSRNFPGLFDLEIGELAGRLGAEEPHRKQGGN